MGTIELVKVASWVYNNRVRQIKKLAKIMAASCQGEGLQYLRFMKEGPRLWEMDAKRDTPLKKGQCTYCKETSHGRNKCLKQKLEVCISAPAGYSLMGWVQSPPFPLPPAQDNSEVGNVSHQFPGGDQSWLLGFKASR